MTDLFPTDPKRIRERIRRYERALKRELETGYGGDGYGKRFLLGPLYMLLGDVDGALASFDWYVEAYPDGGGEPYQYLTWALALFRGGRREEAFNKLYQTMLENLYLVPFLLGRNPQPLDIWHGSNREWMEYAVEIPHRSPARHAARLDPERRPPTARPDLLGTLCARGTALGWHPRLK